MGVAPRQAGHGPGPAVCTCRWARYERALTRRRKSLAPQDGTGGEGQQAGSGPGTWRADWNWTPAAVHVCRVTCVDLGAAPLVMVSRRPLSWCAQLLEEASRASGARGGGVADIRRRPSRVFYSSSLGQPCQPPRRLGCGRSRRLPPCARVKGGSGAQGWFRCPIWARARTSSAVRPFPPSRRRLSEGAVAGADASAADAATASAWAARSPWPSSRQSQGRAGQSAWRASESASGQSGGWKGGRDRMARRRGQATSRRQTTRAPRSGPEPPISGRHRTRDVRPAPSSGRQTRRPRRPVGVSRRQLTPAGSTVGSAGCPHKWDLQFAVCLPVCRRRCLAAPLSPCLCGVSPGRGSGRPLLDRGLGRPSGPQHGRREQRREEPPAGGQQPTFFRLRRRRLASARRGARQRDAVSGRATARALPRSRNARNERPQPAGGTEVLSSRQPVQSSGDLLVFSVISYLVLLRMAPLSGSFWAPSHIRLTF